MALAIAPARIFIRSPYILIAIFNATRSHGLIAFTFVYLDF